MADHRVIAAVTATLRHILRVAVREVSSNARVRVGSTPGEGSAPEVCLSLVQAELNRSFRNGELPVRSPAGGLIARRQMALDLYYLVAFGGDPESLLPERLLGACASRLEAQAVPAAGVIEAAIQEAAAEGVELEGCGLVEQAGRLRFVLDQESERGSARQEPRAPLSLAYRGTVLLPVPERAAPGPVHPVS